MSSGCPGAVGANGFHPSSGLARLGCAALFAGRGWQLLRGTPTALVPELGPWTTQAAGLALMVCALGVLAARRDRRWPAALGLAIVALVCALEVARTGAWLGRTLSPATQLFAATVLVLGGRGTPSRWSLPARLSVAATFLGHGLYGVGWYPLPDEWSVTARNLFDVPLQTVKAMTLLAGVADIGVAVALCLPARLTRLTAAVVAYATVWGAFTAWARTAGCAHEGVLTILDQCLYKTVYRIPHATVPLLLWFQLTTRAGEVDVDGGGAVREATDRLSGEPPGGARWVPSAGTRRSSRGPAGC